MHTPKEIIKILMPDGSRGERRKWELFPRWPPDLFAVMAHILRITDGYTALLKNDHENSFIPTDELKAAKRLGHYWRKMTESDLAQELGGDNRPVEYRWHFEKTMQTYWKNVYKCNIDFYNYNLGSEALKSTILLAIIADEACQGMGYYNFNEAENSKSVSWISVVYNALNNNVVDIKNLRNQANDSWYYAAINEQVFVPDNGKPKTSACILVPPSILCVQPKSRTSDVGCTLRSLTHNLCLLPSEGQVKVRWHQYPILDDHQDETFNILIVPFPYKVDARCFKPSKIRINSKWQEYSIEQKWLYSLNSNQENKSIYMDDFCKFLSDLIHKSKENVKKVDLLIFPELAMDEHLYNEIANKLNEKHGAGIGLLISGVLKSDKKNSSHINGAKTTIYTFKDGNSVIAGGALQKKHHRWKLDRKQIQQYGLSDALAPSKSWWEDIDIDNREINVFSFKGGACFTTLICEDLARMDPCHEVLRSIGPNIVFALLMDGPQLRGRWPERYAMGLSDDPGSSVLTLTSLGLLNRANYFYGSDSRAVGLWRDPEEGTKEIILPKGAHAILMTLNVDKTEETSLDGRCDNGSHLWRLGSLISVTSSIPVDI